MHTLRKADNFDRTEVTGCMGISEKWSRHPRESQSNFKSLAVNYTNKEGSHLKEIQIGKTNAKWSTNESFINAV